ncbi:hypothetical protein ACFX10_000325 [Malus domestica]
MGDPLGSSSLSSQKQNREGVVEAQNGQYRATVVSSRGCGGGPGRDVTINQLTHPDLKCALGLRIELCWPMPRR